MFDAVLSVVVLAALFLAGYPLYRWHHGWRRVTRTYRGGPLNGQVLDEFDPKEMSHRYSDCTEYRFPATYSLYTRKGRLFIYAGEYPTQAKDCKEAV